MRKRSTEGLAGTTVRALKEKGRASEGAAGGAAGDDDRAGGQWKTIGAVAASIVARCQRYRMTCAN